MPASTALRLLTVCWVCFSVGVGTISDRGGENHTAVVQVRSKAPTAPVATLEPPPPTPTLDPPKPQVVEGNATLAMPTAPTTPNTQVEAIIREVWPGDDEAALRVAMCESHLDPTKVGRAGEKGLMQLHPVHRSWLGPRWDLLFDPVENLKAAWELYSEQGASPWTCARKLGIRSM